MKHKEKSKQYDQIVEEYLNYEEIQESPNDVEVDNDSEFPSCDNYELIEVESPKEVPVDKDIVCEIDDNVLLQQVDETLVIVEKIETLVEDDFISSNLQFADQENEDFFDELIEEEDAKVNDGDEMSSKNDQQHVCDLCGNIFKSKSNLNRHITRKHHKNNHKFSCEFCNSKFHLQFDLKRHLIKHSDQRDYSCSLCDTKTKTKLSMRIHRMTLHNNTPRGEKSFKCEFCDRSYYHKRHRDYHMRKHTGIDNFNCQHVEKISLH